MCSPARLTGSRCCRCYCSPIHIAGVTGRFCLIARAKRSCVPRAIPPSLRPRAADYQASMIGGPAALRLPDPNRACSPSPRSGRNRNGDAFTPLYGLLRQSRAQPLRHFDAVTEHLVHATANRGHLRERDRAQDLTAVLPCPDQARVAKH